MKYHVIKGVPVDVCTAEQMVSYRLAFKAHIAFQEKFDYAVKISNVCASELIRDIITVCLDFYVENGGKYDIDAIFCCLNSGLYEYMSHGKQGREYIALDHNQVGSWFPANYRRERRTA